MSFLDRLFPGSHPHFEERHALLGQLEATEWLPKVVEGRQVVGC